MVRLPLQRTESDPAAIAVDVAADDLALQRCETIIESGLETFVGVGLALMEIRASRLYLKTHKTFEAYCRDRWGLSARHANRQIASAEVAGIVSAADTAAVVVRPIGPAPTAESQARELMPLRDDPAAMRAVWRAAVASSGGRTPTAADVRRARMDHDRRRAERRTQRQARADESARQAADAYLESHGHPHDHLRVISHLRRLLENARRQLDLIGADQFDYTTDERAEAALIAGSIIETLTAVRSRLDADRLAAAPGTGWRG